MIFLCESCSASRARFDAISPQIALVLPRCGVPRKTTSLVRSRHASDLHNAYNDSQDHILFKSGAAPLSYVFDNNAAEAVRHENNGILTCNKPFVPAL